jgi:hypothetical protein
MTLSGQRGSSIEASFLSGREQMVRKSVFRVFINENRVCLQVSNRCITIVFSCPNSCHRLAAQQQNGFKVRCLARSASGLPECPAFAVGVQPLAECGCGRMELTSLGSASTQGSTIPLALFAHGSHLADHELGESLLA